MPITKQTDYLGEARGRQLEQFKGLPRMDAMLLAFSAEAQALENALWDIYTLRLLQNNPTGDLLAKLGKIVGQTSLGLPDPQFQLLIEARIRVNRTNGTHGDLITIGLLLGSVDPTAAVRVVPTIYVKEYGTASVMVMFPAVVNPYVIGQQFLGAATMAGVMLMFVWTQAAAARTIMFGWYGGAMPTVPGVNQSPGWSGAPGGGGLMGGMVLGG